MIFPKLSNKKRSYLNLNTLGRQWLEKHQARFGGHERNMANPLNVPEITAEMVEDFHHSLGLGFSHGGYLEDRRELWRESYLEAGDTFIHLGVDINAPAGTEIAVDFPAEVVFTGDDYPLVGGWGTWAILKHVEIGDYVLFGHLHENLGVYVGDVLKPGDILARVGKSPRNGFWYPHVHVQRLSQLVYQTGLKNKFVELDGYGKGDIEALKRDFPDPMWYINFRE